MCDPMIIYPCKGAYDNCINFFNGCNPFAISFKLSKACVPPSSSSIKTKELNKHEILNF